jgi:glycosyltransferase involved in cell wall biosynthesis
MSTSATPDRTGATAAAPQPLVAILLCTYQGEEFLPAQLNSIATQTHRRWTVWASDDGSRDATPEILARYRIQWGTELIEVVAGPRQGFAVNFVSLICRPEIAADHYAFADQDDLWEADKLARAIAWLETI